MAEHPGGVPDLAVRRLLDQVRLYRVKAGSGTPPGCRTSFAPLPGGRRPPRPGDLRLSSGNPSG
jgi:hypothetical protein